MKFRTHLCDTLNNSIYTDLWLYWSALCSFYGRHVYLLATRILGNVQASTASYAPPAHALSHVTAT